MERHVPTWTFSGVAHGFGERDAPVASGFHLVRAKQVHGTAILEVDERTPSPAGEADALITSRPGVAVAVATADCVPLLIAAPEAGVVAAVHAGWRGTLAGISQIVLDRIVRDGGVRTDEVQVAIGPAIGGCCFEIEKDLAERFADRFGAGVWSAWRDGRPGKGTLDLHAVNAMSLVEAGVPETAITHVGPCTVCGGANLASFRAQGESAGRQLSWIALLS